MFTKQNTKQKVYKHVMFIKQKVFIQVMFTKQNKMFTDMLCLQNKQMFTKQTFYNTLCSQNKILNILLSQRVNFETFHNLSVFHSDDFVNFT